MDFPLRQATQTQPAGVFAAKLKGEGSGLIFSTYFGGSGYYGAQAVAADGSGNTYVGGNITGDASAPGDVFVAAWNGETGAPLYATYLGGSKTDYFSSLAVDSGGNAYIAGSTNSPDFPRKYAYEYAFGAAYQDAFLAKIAPGTAGPSISLSSVANAASYTSTVSPGEIVSLFGKRLAVTPATAAGAPLPVQLSDAQVSVSGTAAPLFYVSPLQINLQVPYETTAGTAQIQVNSGSGTATLNVPIGPAAPAIFTLNSLGNGAGAIEHALTGQLVTRANPAAAGEVVAVYCTGLGAVSPPVADGAAAPVPPAQAVMAVTASIADTPAPVIFAGLTPGFAGLYQVNLQIPAGTPSGVQNLAMSVNGTASNTVALAVH